MSVLRLRRKQSHQAAPLPVLPTGAPRKISTPHPIYARLVRDRGMPAWDDLPVGPIVDRGRLV